MAFRVASRRSHAPVVCRRSAALRLWLRFAAARAQPVVRKGTEPCSLASLRDSAGGFAPLEPPQPGVSVHMVGVEGMTPRRGHDLSSPHGAAHRS